MANKETTMRVMAQPLAARMEELREEGLRRAGAMVAGKGGDYGGFWEYSEVEIAALGRVKGKRALNLAIKRSANPDARANFEAIEDTCLDAINYYSFLYAIAVAKKEGTI